jgi:uncharacterized membrane protein
MIIADANDERLDRIVGRALLIGLLVSVAVMVLGLVLTALSGGKAGSVVRLSDLPARLAAGSAPAVLDLGILLLIATPPAAVATALLSFLRAQEDAFALISLLLLGILGAGLVIALR